MVLLELLSFSISPRCSLEGMMLKLKLQYFGHLMRRVDSLEKTDAGRDWEQEEKGTTEDEMAGWHHWLDGRESEWTLGDGDGQGGLACCDSCGCKELDTTEWLNWTELRASHFCVWQSASCGIIMERSNGRKYPEILLKSHSLYYIGIHAHSQFQVHVTVDKDIGWVLVSTWGFDVS